jgi:hypothetical protein
MIVRNLIGEPIGKLRDGIIIVLAVGDTYNFCNGVLRSLEFNEVHFVHSDGDIFTIKKEKIFDINNEEGYRPIKVKEQIKL